MNKKNSSEVFYMNDLYDTKILASLSDAEGKVYGAYLRYSNGGKDQAYPSQDKLAENMGLARRTVGRAVKKLLELGYIKQVSSGKGGESERASVFIVRTPAQLGFTVNKTPVTIKATGVIELDSAAASAVAMGTYNFFEDMKSDTPTEPVEAIGVLELGIAVASNTIDAIAVKEVDTTPTVAELVEVDIAALADKVYSLAVQKNHREGINKEREDYIRIYEDNKYLSKQQIQTALEKQLDKLAALPDYNYGDIRNLGVHLN